MHLSGGPMTNIGHGSIESDRHSILHPLLLRLDVIMDRIVHPNLGDELCGSIGQVLASDVRFWDDKTCVKISSRLFWSGYLAVLVAAIGSVFVVVHSDGTLNVEN